MSSNENTLPDPKPVSYRPQSRSADEYDARPGKRGYWWLVFVVAAVAVLLDQLTKWWALANLTEGVPRPFLGNFITLQLVYNPGAAFSMGEGSTWIFTVLSALVIGILIWYSSRVYFPILAVIVGLLMGGAFGNLIDRLFQPPGFARGHVVDFLNYNSWFVGNVADIWIVVAAAALALWLLVQSERSNPKESANVSVREVGDKKK